MKKWIWTAAFCLVAIIGLALTFGASYPLTVPRALLAIEAGQARVVPLTPDAVKLVARRGSSEQQLTSFLEQRGWTYKETLEGRIVYEKEGITLSAASRFRRGYWWYDLDKAP